MPEVISPDTRVPLVQPDFPEHEVLFIEAYFMHYVKKYKKAYKIGGERGARMEKRLDKAITQRSVGSYKRRVWIHDKYSAARNGLKNFLVNSMPKFYLFLRRQKHKKKAQV